MGRLNYTNRGQRKVEGAKLGDIVYKDLVLINSQKTLLNIDSNTNRLRQAKRIPPEFGSKAALRDPSLELNLSGKLLTDQGLTKVLSGLEQAITYQTEHGVKIIRLEELSLSGNELTVAALSGISSIISLTAKDFKDLDLSNNKITVQTKEDVVCWENFLMSFKTCSSIRRLDFSGNALGPKAFEVLARVYVREEALTQTVSTLDTGVLLGCNLAETCAEIDVETSLNASLEAASLNADAGIISVSPMTPHPATRRGSRKGLPHVVVETGPPVGIPTKVGPVNTTCGLQSIPYIIVANTSMADISALHISYVLAMHDLPSLLLQDLGPAKSGHLAQQMGEYDTKSGCRGIVYLPNADLTVHGRRVLELAEKQRVSLQVLGFDEDNQQELDDSPLSSKTSGRGFDISPYGLGEKTPRRHSHYVLENQINSPGGAGSEGELERIRTKIQTNSLKELGVGSVELWSTALKLLTVSRSILVDSPAEVSTGQTKSLVEEIPSPTTFQKKVAPELSASPIKRKLILRGSFSADTKSGGLLPSPIPERLPYNLPSPRALPSLTSSVETSPRSDLTREENLAAEERLRFNLTLTLWRRILVMAVDPEGILTERQQLAVLQWAALRSSLTKEREAGHKMESVQIWSVLNSMGCIAYET
ncbi:MAG: hypothetical protein M1829_005644 [Trizodia sp. TS-e1964]|nr:MAG: hypothetical protein M1829_005644 [Trizodia sp. TS-e1964]